MRNSQSKINEFFIEEKNWEKLKKVHFCTNYNKLSYWGKCKHFWKKNLKEYIKFKKLATSLGRIRFFSSPLIVRVTIKIIIKKELNRNQSSGIGTFESDSHCTNGHCMHTTVTVVFFSPPHFFLFTELWFISIYIDYYQLRRLTE